MYAFAHGRGDLVMSNGRHHARSSLGLAAACALAAFAPARPAQACYGLPDSPAEAFSDAATVFVGTVKRMEIRNTDDAIISRLQRRLSGDHLGGSGDQRYVTFDVTNAWKAVTTPVLVVTFLSAGDSGYPFEVGRSYLVYAVEDGGYLYTTLCHRTTEISSAAEDLSYLQGMPKVTVRSSPRWLLILAGAAPVLIALAAAVLWTRRSAAAKPADRS